jgi:hypothetical protein
LSTWRKLSLNWTFLPLHASAGLAARANPTAMKPAIDLIATTFSLFASKAKPLLTNYQNYGNPARLAKTAWRKPRDQPLFSQLRPD